MVTHPDFIIIPTQLIQDRNLEGSDRVLYGIIYWFEHLKNEKCTASNETLAELCSIDPRSIKNSLERLETGGYIKRTYKDESCRHRISIQTLIAFKKVKPEGTRLPSKKSTEGTRLPSRGNQNVPLEGNLDDQNKNIEKEDTKNIRAGVNLSPFLEGFKEVNPSWQRLYKNTTERAALTRLIQDHGAETVSKWIAALPQIIVQPYAPRITTPYQLEMKLGDLMTFAAQNKSKQKPISAKL